MYTLIMTTYSMNKRGFHCALLRSVFSLILFFPNLYSSLFFASILSSLLPHFFVKPLQVSNSLSFAYLFLTSVSCTRLHYEDQVRTAPRKRTFILLDSLISTMCFTVYPRPVPVDMSSFYFITGTVVTV